MFKVYIEREIFEEICCFDDYPNWKKIFSRQTQVYINMTDDELDNELSDEESPIFVFQNTYAATAIPIALDSQFEALKEDIESIVDYHPRDAFIFDIEPDEAYKLASDLGVAVFSSRNLKDNFFSGGLFEELELGQKIAGGWQSLISIDLPISNSLIISDEYLFQNEEGDINCGIGNLPNLFDVFLPQKLRVDYHITILARNGGKSRDWWIKEFGALKATISSLRDYNIKFELVFTKTIHKRRIISNYINGWADKGFSIFRNTNPEKVREDNDIHIYRIFDNINNTGDTHYISSSKGIAQIKEKCDSAAQYIKRQNETEHATIFGDCNKDKTIRNRLLN